MKPVCVCAFPVGITRVVSSLANPIKAYALYAVITFLKICPKELI